MPRVAIHRNETSQSIVYEGPTVSAYTKGPMYCVSYVDTDTDKRVVHKYPLCQIFRVVEDY